MSIRLILKSSLLYENVGFAFGSIFGLLNARDIANKRAKSISILNFQFIEKIKTFKKSIVNRIFCIIVNFNIYNPNMFIKSNKYIFNK